MRRELQLEIARSAAELGAGFHRDMVRQTWIFAGSLLTAAGVVSSLLH